MKSALAAATLLCLVISCGAVFAQSPAPANQPASSAKASKSDKQAISKACSDQANAKGLHGKERKKFRSECKRAGGKPK